MKKIILLLGLILAITMISSSYAQTSDAKTFYIDDTFKIGWTDGIDNYEAHYKVWKIEEQQGENITIFTLVPGGGITFHSLDRHFISLGSTGKLIINEIYVSGDDRWISVTLENVEFKEEYPTTTPPGSGDGGGGQGGGCFDTDGGKDLFEKGISAGVYDNCISKYKINERYCTGDNVGADFIGECPLGYICSDGACIKSDEDDRDDDTTPTTTYFKNCNYIWDSSPYVGQTVKITASIKDASGSVDSDSVEVNVLESVLGGGGGAYPMDGKTLDIQIIEPGSGEVAGAVEIKINSKGPAELGEMSLGLSGDRWGAGFPISNKNCVAGGSGGGGSGGGTTCDRYHICEDGSEVQYCEIIKQYDDNGNVAGAGCACKQNPEELCTPSSSGGGGGGGQPVEIPSSGGGGSGGNNETPIICNGCILGDKCAPVGYRVEGKYCNLDSTFINYLGSGETCDNNFECKSNLCIDSECISGGLFKRFLNWFRRMFGGE